jgi:hypothetical protein
MSLTGEEKLMKLVLNRDVKLLGREAALLGAESIMRAINDHGSASIVLATGASQFEVMNALRESTDIARHRVTGRVRWRLSLGASARARSAISAALSAVTSSGRAAGSASMRRIES